MLRGISLGGNPTRYLANLGAILVDGLAVLITLFLLWRSNRKRAAVGRREIQLFLLGYIIISICDIFTVGGIPLNDDARRGFTAVHLAAIAATFWILMLNGLVGFQLIDDGTPLSVILVLGSAAAVFIGTGYISLDTAFDWTGHFSGNSYGPLHRNIGLYVLYQLLPCVAIFVFLVLETILVLRVLQEKRPMIWLLGAGLFFAIGQIFQYVISIHICRPTNGAIDGNFFQALFDLLAVIMIWIFWSSITEDDWPVA